MPKIFLKKLEVFIEKNNCKENIFVAFHLIGYKKHSTIKNKLIIDENVVDIVREIFFMYSNGYGSVEIVNFLNKNNFLSPKGYRITGVVQDQNKNSYNWNEVTVCNMLKNEVYIGNTVQNKKSDISYKVKKIRTVEKEHHIKVTNTHDAIIDTNIFEKVQCIFEKKGTNPKLKYDYALRGLLYCHHCKKKLQIVLKKNSKINSKTHPYITCINYKKRNCFPLNINYYKLEKYIFYILQNIFITYGNKDIFGKIYNKKFTKNSNTKIYFIKNLEKINNKIIDLNNNLDKMYIDKLKNIITEDDYFRISRKFMLDRLNLIRQKKELEYRLEKFDEYSNIANKLENTDSLNILIEKFLKLDDIHNTYIYRLINKIEIDNEKNVYIFFNFSRLKNITKDLNEFINIEQIMK